MTKTYKFKARIESTRGGGACVFFPYDVQKEFGTRGRVRVKGAIDGVPYTGSMMKYGAPQHMLGILKKVREQIGKSSGEMVEVTVEKDETERIIEAPPEFEKLLKKEKVWAAFEKLSYTHKKEYVRWISEAKREETRAIRIAKSVEMLRSGRKSPDNPGK